MSEKPVENRLTMIGREDGGHFETFLRQPPVEDALARYVYEEARHLLRSSLSGASPFGPSDPQSPTEPAWLTADEDEAGACKADRAECALEIALQSEVERRLRLALDAAEGPAQARAEASVLSLARRTAQALQRNADALRGVWRQENEAAFAAAGLTAAPPVPPKTEEQQ